MITGLVNSKLEAVVSLVVHGAQEEIHQIEAVIDTGYSGYLALSSELIAAFGLTSIGTQQVTLADGNDVDSALCPATITWDGNTRVIEVYVLETVPLIGMALLDGYELKICVAIGGGVTIEPFYPSRPPIEQQH